MSSEALQNFSFDYLQILVKQTNGNVFLSPLSIFASLSMVLLGAKNNSAVEIEKSLRFLVTEKEKVHKSISNMVKEISKSNPEVILKIANGMFPAKNFEINKEYSKNLKEYYKIQSTQVDYIDAEKAAKFINKWIEENTNHKIKDMFKSSSFDHSTKLVLANAVYFKGPFKEQFHKEATKEMDFYKSDGDKKKVQMMSMMEDFSYAEDENLGLKIVELPFIDSRYKLIIGLPIKRFNLDDILMKLDGSAFRNLINSAEDANVELKLPKFKLETDMNLKMTLPQLGINDIFDPLKADLGGIADVVTGNNRLVVDEAIHKTFLDVNEHGVEAAAATAMKMMLMSAFDPFPKREVKFIVDEPFLVSIYQRIEECVIFLGRINDP